MASIRARNGKLVFDFKYRGQRCREQTVLEDTPRNRKIAEKKLSEIVAKITLDQFVYRDYFPKSKKLEHFERLDIKTFKNSGVPSFGEFTRTWIEENRFEWSTSHKKNVEHALNRYFLPEFERIPLNEISKSEIKKLRIRIAQNGAYNRPLNNNSVNKLFSVLKVILDEASREYEFTSPFRYIKRLRRSQTDIDPFSRVEVQQIIDNIREDYRCYVIVRFFTGLRSCEINVLKWANIDFKNRVIKVREALVRGEITELKTNSSARDVFMVDAVFNALSDWKKLTNSKDLVFTNAAGNAVDTVNFAKRIWKPLLQSHNIRYRKPYSTRHTAATLWLASGEAAEFVAKQLGHKTTEMLFRVYSNYIPNTTRRDGSAFDQLISAKFNTD